MKISAILIVSMLGFVGIGMPLTMAGNYGTGFYLHEFEIRDGNPIENQEFTIQISVRHSDSSVAVYYPPLISHYHLKIGEDDGNGGFFTIWTNQDVYRNDDIFFDGGGDDWSEWAIIGVVDDLVSHDTNKIRISFQLFDTSNNVVAEDSKAWVVQDSAVQDTPIDDESTGGLDLKFIAVIGVVIAIIIVIAVVIKIAVVPKKPPMPPIQP
jgi:hypothetical protein